MSLEHCTSQLFKKVEIPFELTGTAVGLISLIGFTPAIFMGLAMDLLIDNSPGELGFQQVFLMLGIFTLTGLLASVFLLSE